MNFIEDKNEDGKIKVALSVTEYLEYVNLLLGHTRKAEVIGEISSVKPHPTGIYMTIRDPHGDAILECYMSPYVFKSLHLPPLEAGMLVRLAGVSSIYVRKGSFRLQITELSLVGEGSSKQAYDLLKTKLEREGIFTRKREIPKNVSRIALITSSTGAVIHDFKKNLSALGLHVSVIDVRVEGKNAPKQIISAIGQVSKNSTLFDVCVIIRGGGSLEDLQAFNTEDVVRAVFACSVPVLAGIGHETDVPLVSLAADFSASTPTAVAVAINGTWTETLLLPEKVMSDILSSFQDLLDKAKLSYLRPLRSIISVESAMQAVYERLHNSCLDWIRDMSDNRLSLASRVSVAWTAISVGDPRRVLERGYSITKDTQGRVITDASVLNEGTTVSTILSTGSFISKVEKINPKLHEEE